MKKLYTFLFAFVTLSVTYGQGFVVNIYDVDVYVSEEGYFDVVEHYDINFVQEKHGIYRNIQTAYTILNEDEESVQREIQISEIKVPGHTFETTSAFVRKISGELKIKIGDADKTVYGLVGYDISYRVHNAFLFNEESTQFYWNIKPSGWIAHFQTINFTIHLPENSGVSLEHCFVYSGPYGATGISEDFETNFSEGAFTGTSLPNAVSTYGESVTVLVKIPPGIIKEIEPAWPFWTTHGYALIIGALLFIFYLLWLRHGKDKRVTTTTAYYPPEDMDPAMAGFLINDKDDTSDLISLIPHWGAMGYIEMEEIDKKSWYKQKDVRITRLKKLPSNAPRYQATLFNELFSKGFDGEVLISSLKNSFYITMNNTKLVLKHAAQKYYIPKSRAVKKILGGVIVILTMVLALVFFYYWGLVAAISMVVCGILLSILNIFMIKKNRRGDAVLSELKGFKEFIKTAEENKLKMLLAENPTYFESTLGYALAFGFFDRWAKKFDDLNVKPPGWHSGPGHTRHSTMNNFSNSFSGSMESTRSSMVSVPSSSSSSGGSFGGGSSGGGFGGGGGGSW